MEKWNEGLGAVALAIYDAMTKNKASDPDAIYAILRSAFPAQTPEPSGQGEADRGPFDMPILTYKPDEPWQKGHIYMLRGDELIEHDARTSESTADARELAEVDTELLLATVAEAVRIKLLPKEATLENYMQAHEKIGALLSFVSARLSRPEPSSEEAKE
jgi:hypothetical protein